jgi:hypothetical protein
MRYLACGLLLFPVFLGGCDQGARGPKLAIPKEQSSLAEQSEPPPPPVARSAASKAPADFHYQGRTIEQWAKELKTSDVDKLRRAAGALRVVGAAGRPYLVQGLQSSLPETRRICLEYLTVADLRVYGEQGKRLLVKLTGDANDCRIRERASLYLVNWESSVPALP